MISNLNKKNKSKFEKKISKSSLHREHVKDHFHDYCMSTSIHGVKYLAEKGRPLGERIWWLTVFIVSFVGTAWLISKVWTKWNTSPVIVSFAESTTPVWQVPFPAVTICSENKARATSFPFTKLINKYNRNTSSITNDEKEKLGMISLLCSDHIRVNSSYYLNNSLYDYYREVISPKNEMFINCFWHGGGISKCKIFDSLITEEGICYTFNMLNESEMFRTTGKMHPYPNNVQKSEGWTLDNGYKEGTKLTTYPNRALDAGAKAGLYISLRIKNVDNDFHCRGPIQGFKILLHNPAEVPSVAERYFRAPANKEVLVAVTPDIMTTSEGLRTYSSTRRQCFFPSERYLSFFKIYTQRNCELECLTNFTLHMCGCVGLHMPRNESTPICGGGKKTCVYDANKNLRVKEINSTYSGFANESCNCLQACTAIQYEAEISQADLLWEDMLKGKMETTETMTTENVSISRVTIFFKDMQFVTSRRSELYGPVDFLANCGGILGLFSGFSVLSIVEIIYYITLRFWSNVREHRRKTQNDIYKDDSPVEMETNNKEPVVEFIN